ncbi:MAG: DUF4837 family protein [Bacteroidales bacterium]|nr:DUF4837 family protein [Bacteroidales bacterium]
MKNRFNVILVLTIPLLIWSCNSSNDTGMPRSSGKTAEMVVVTNNETKWEGMIGDSIRAFFGQDYEVLPQSEPLFEMANMQIAKFNETKMLKAHHNIFIVDINPKVKKASIEAKKDVWASPQSLVKIEAPDDPSFINFFEEKKDVILNIFMESEYERLIKTFKAFRDRDVQKSIEGNFGFTMQIPSGFYIAKQLADFSWIRKETQNNSQGLIVYTYDFVDTLAFDQARIISFRNNITQEYIPGPSEGSYMTVADEFSPVISKRIDFNGRFAVKTMGLWRLEGDFMGGPFVNYTFVDEKRNKVITIDGYVYAPNAPKRDLLIQMDAIIHSLKFVN